MVVFDESFADGFFGIGRTYGAVARIELRAGDDLAADWAGAVEQTERWVESRGEKARSITFLVIAPPERRPAVWEFVGELFFLRRGELPEVLRKLWCEVALFDADGEVYFHLDVPAVQQ